MCSNMDWVHEKVQEVETLANENNLEINNVEQYDRRHNLIASGIPKQENENLDEKVIELFNSIEGVHVEPDHISIAHRMPLSEKSRSGIPDVIVRFSSRKVRKTIYENKKKIAKIAKSALTFDANPRQIFISENLTKRNNEIFYHARNLKRQGLIKYAWTKHGKVHVRKFAASEAIPIDILDDLRQ